MIFVLLVLMGTQLHAIPFGSLDDCKAAAVMVSKQPKEKQFGATFCVEVKPEDRQ